MDLRHHITPGGLRMFGWLPARIDPVDLVVHLAALDGLAVTDSYQTFYIDDSYIDFEYRGYSFDVDCQFAAYNFFVRDPKCPDEILLAVLGHCEAILPPRQPDAPSAP